VIVNEKKVPTVHASAPRAGAAGTGRPRRVRSAELLGPAGDLIIEHAGRDYRLRITSNGKLILTG